MSKSAFLLPVDAKKYFLVQVFSDSEEMVESIQELRGKKRRDDADVRACTLRYEAVGVSRSGKKQITGELGTLFFNATDLHFGVAIHELTHAAIYAARRLGIDPMKRNPTSYSRCPEERFVRILQSMTEKFYAKLPLAIEDLKRAEAKSKNQLADHLMGILTRK